MLFLYLLPSCKLLKMLFASLCITLAFKKIFPSFFCYTAEKHGKKWKIHLVSIHCYSGINFVTYYITSQSLAFIELARVVINMLYWVFMISWMDFICTDAYAICLCINDDWNIDALVFFQILKNPRKFIYSC